MQKKLFIVIMMLFFNCLWAQNIPFEKPNYNLIKENIAQKDGKFFYPKLEKRLLELDTLLTKDDFRHLYYGYVFQKKYDAFWRSPVEKEITVFYKQSKIDPADHPKIIKLLNKSIAAFPFDLQSYNFLYFIEAQTGNNDESMKLAKISQGLFGAILSSGDGKTCETGFHVLLTSHEYALLNMFNLQSVEQSLVESCDFLKFEKGKYKVEGLFFDVTKIMENRQSNTNKKIK